MNIQFKLHHFLAPFHTGLALLWLAVLTLPAAVPSGSYSFGPFNGAFSSIYDISGTYEIEESIPMDLEPPLEISFDITIVQDGKGKITGAGLTMIDFEQDGDDLDTVPAFYEVKGKIKTAADNTLVFILIKGFGSGPLLGFDQDYVVQTKIKTVIDRPNDRFIGGSKGKAFASAFGTSKFDNFASYDLKGGVDGSWSLDLNITPDGDKLLGTGTIRLPRGVDLFFDLNGKYKGTSDEAKMKLTGTGDVLGAKMNKIVTGESGTSLLLYKGKVLGQKVQWEMQAP